MGMQEEEARQFSAEEMLAYHIHVLNSGMLETESVCLFIPGGVRALPAVITGSRCISGCGQTEHEEEQKEALIASQSAG